METGTRPPTGYVRRVVDDELDELLRGLPAVSIEGPKGVGKTATALSRASTTYRLDDVGELEVTAAYPPRLTQGKEPILIDEWQLYPSSWDLVRRSVDEAPRAGRFLLTGSANPAGPATHTGAARIVPIRMRPMSLMERGVPTTVSLRSLLKGDRSEIDGQTDFAIGDYVSEILASGFPALRGLAERPLRAQLNGYLERVIDREFPAQGLALRHPDSLRAWMRAYAAATSTTSSYEVIRNAATPGVGNKPARTTTLPYRDVLTRLWLLDPVPAWLPANNKFKELGTAEKHNFVDPALAARLLDITHAKLLEGGTGAPASVRQGSMLGALFESLVALNLRVYAQGAEAQVRHMRTHRGEREVDFIIEGVDGRIVAIEVKLAATVSEADVAHLRWLRSSLGDELADAMVVTTGRNAYRRPDGIAVVPAALLGA